MRQSARQIERLDVPEDVGAPVEFRSSEEAPRMLIADDDPSIVRLLADHCARMGFDVETASNGIQALLKAGRLKPDILVVDVNMPEVDGLSVCAHLLGPDRAPVNVIVITGSRDPDTHREMRRLWGVLRAQGAKFLERFRSCASGDPSAHGRQDSAMRYASAVAGGAEASVRAADRRRQ
jgi:CheY-like chemotaxis protein